MQQTSIRLCESGEDCAIVFSRTPVAGAVKSRLWTHLTPEQACRLHCASTNDVLALVDQALPAVKKWLFLSDEQAAETLSYGLHLPPGFGCSVQEGTDLGERMGAAFTRAFACGARRVVIFGSDSPTLSPQTVQQSFQQLDSCDVVLGSTEDGGYYLVGCRRFDPQLFHEVEWSTPRTFAQTLANARQSGCQVSILDSWFDLDEWKDVERLLSDARRGVPVPAYMARFLSRLADNR